MSITETHFELTVSPSGEVPVLSVRGEIDHATAPHLLERLVSMRDSVTKRLVIDLTDVSFIDSTGMGMLVAADEFVRSLGGELRLVVSVPDVLRVFTITGSVVRFKIHPTLSGALSA